MGLALCGVDPAQAQVLDAARGFEDGCARSEPPPNSRVARSDQGPVVLARYFGATDAYRHGVLGDAIEAEGLLVRFDDGARVVCDTVMAGADRVFEDTGPRLADLNNDGVNEVIAVASHADFGARLEVYGYPGPGRDFQRLAETPYIGRAFRWLAPVGAADLDGDGAVEIAYVDRPHLAKVLRIWRYGTDGLAPVADLPGFTNHAIGWDFIAGGLRSCGGRNELILASGDWSTIQAVTLSADGDLSARELARFDGPISLDAAMACGD